MAKRKLRNTVKYIFVIPNKTGAISTIPFEVERSGYIFDRAMKYLTDNNLQHLGGKLFCECDGYTQI